MIRKVKVTAILLSMLVFQSMNWRHSHAGVCDENGREHDARPHVHFHFHNTHCHSHESELGAEGADLGVAPTKCPLGHDDDAVFLSNFEFTKQSRATPQLNLAGRLPTFAVFAASEFGPLTAEMSFFRLRGKSVAIDQEDCPLYLRTLSLRL